MKQLVTFFLTLLSIFFLAWFIKIRTPVNRPVDMKTAKNAVWYQNNYQPPVADTAYLLDSAEIPDNYVPVPGYEELYMVIDDNGTILRYVQRTKESDGKWTWKTVNPDIPEGYEPVNGVENVYKVHGDDNSDEYLKYIRNDDGTYCFVPCDENGLPLDVGRPADVIDTEHYIKETGNIYALYNDNGILEGYRERVEDITGNNKFVWAMADKPDKDIIIADISELTGNKGNQKPQGMYPTVTPVPTVYEKTSDNTFTETQTIQTQEIKDGYLIIYETKIINVYDVTNGLGENERELLETQKIGPTEISRIPVGGSSTEVDKSLIAGTLDAEYVRVSTNVEYDSAKEADLLAKINAFRISAGLNELKTDAVLNKWAQVRAADMSIYDHSSSSPMYGTLEEMNNRWKIVTSLPVECILKTTIKDSTAILSRFQANENAKATLTNSGLIKIGIGIVEKNGQDYIAIIMTN